MKSALSLPLLLCATSLTACSTPSIKPSQDKSLVALACPLPTPLLGRDRNTLVRKLEEMGAQYRKCRTAALSGPPDKAP